MSPQTVPKVHCLGCQAEIVIRTSKPKICIPCKKCGMKMEVNIPEQNRYKAGELDVDPSFEYMDKPSSAKKIQFSASNRSGQPAAKKAANQKTSSNMAENRAAQHGKRTVRDTFKYKIPGVDPSASSDATVYITVSDRKTPEMMAYIRSQYPKLLSGVQPASTDLDAISKLVRKVFTPGISGKYILTNLVHTGSDGKAKNTIAVRSTACRYLSSIVGNGYQMKLLGHIGQRSKFYVEKLEIVQEAPPAANEKEVRFQVQYSEPTTSNPFIWTLVQSVPSYVDGAKDELQHWAEYLEWKQELAALKICGVKYIGFRVVLDESTPVGLSFLCAAPDERTFQIVRRAFQADRDQIVIYSNQVSKNRWLFNYDTSSSSKTERGLQLTLAGITKHTEPDYVWSDYFGYARKSAAEGTHPMPVSEARKMIERDRGYTEPVYFEIEFLIPADSEEYINRNGLFGDEAAHFLAKDVFSHICSDGFITTSRIGDFALNNRLKRGLSDLRAGHAVSGNLGNWIFDITKARFSDKPPEPIVWSEWGDEHLNPSQKQIVQSILNAPDVFLCQGPPGTGKTTVIAETVYQLTQRGKRVIIASQTNLAVNNALSKLLSYPSIRAIRLGSESKIDDSVEAITDQNILRTFFTGIRDRVVKTYLEPWHHLDEQTAELQRTHDYAAELLQQMHTLSAERLNLEVSLREAALQIDGAIAKINSSSGDNEYIEYKAALYQGFSESLRNGRVPSQKAQITAEQAETLYLKLSPYIHKLYQAGYSVLPQFAAPDIGFRGMTVKETAFSIFDLASFCLLAVYGPQTDDADKRKEDLLVRKLQLELRELEESDDDSFEAFQKRKEIKTQLKLLAPGAGHNQLPPSIVKMLPENLRQSVDLDDLCNQLKTDAGYAGEIITILADFYDQLGQELLAGITASEEELNTLRTAQGSCREKLAGINAALAETVEELNILLQRYGKTENSILSFLEEQIMQIRNTAPADPGCEDFRDFLTDFVDYVDRVGDDYSLENEIYLTSFVNACNVVGVSCTESSYTLTEKGFTSFDVAIVDEVSKATPPEILLPLLLAEKAVLVGDHRQLPPLFGEHYNSYQEYLQDLDEDDVEGHALLTDDNFSRFEELVTNSLFKRHYEQAAAANKGALLAQYRMHREIMDVVNIFYDGLLTPGYSTEKEAQYKAHHAVINSAYGPARLISPEHHAYWIDTSSYKGRNIFEENKGTSKYNRLEALAIVEMLRQIDESYDHAGISAVEVGVISFYAEQVRLIKELVRTRCRLKVIKCDINTVDRFQGKEKEIVLVSLVRNVPHGRHFDATFVKDYRRINVAMSRAQALLLVVGAKDMYADQEIVIENMDDGTPLPPRKAYRDIIEMLHIRGCYIMAEDILGDAAAEVLFREE